MHDSHQWYLSRPGRQFGPATTEQFRRWVSSGRVAPDDMVFRSGAADWAPAANYPALASHWPAVPGSAYTSAAGLVHGATAGFAGYAGFWKRFAALIIDFFVLLAPFLLVHVVIGLFGSSDLLGPNEPNPVANLITMLMTWLYHALMEASSAQGSVGKLALNIKVTDMYGRPITFARATGRYWARLIWYPTLGVGGMMIGFTERRQGLHDMLARTLVVNR